jgi:putative tricarboxylic transport membrane protein
MDETYADRSRRSAEERLEHASVSDPTDADEAVLSNEDVDVATRDLRKEVAVAAVVVVVGIAFIVLSAGIRQGSIPDPITSSGLPRIVGGMLMLFGGVLTGRYVLAWVRHPDQLRVPSAGGDDEVGFPASATRAFLFLAGCGVWAWTVPRIGYFIATPLALAAALAAMGIRSRVKLVAISLGFTIIAWLMFYELLGIQLPLGFLEAPARDLGVIA